MSTPLLRRAGAASAALVAAVAMAVSPASADAVPGAMITGVVTDAGVPVPNATVQLQLADFPASAGRTVTDTTGSFRLAGVPAGRYKLKFGFPGGLTQFHAQRPDFASATVLTVAAGQAVTVTESLVPHGSLRGRITTSAGAGVPAAVVGLMGPDGVPLASVTADQDGRYLLPYVAAGPYRVFVDPAARSAPRQWVRQQRSRDNANPVTVTVGGPTTLDERLLPLGTISGRLRDAAGPVAGATVYATSLTSADESVSATTQGDGTFRMLAYPGRYKVRFVSPDRLDQWSPGRVSERLAEVVTVTADAATVLDERALPAGRAEGRLTDTDGSPVPGAAVVLSDHAREVYFQATTDEDGSWFHAAWPGEYEVRFSTGNRVQWATGADSPATADPVSVSADRTTVVDDTLLAPASLAVTAVDAATGAALTSFCATTNSEFVYERACTEDGTARIAAISGGTYRVTVSSVDHLDSVTSGVRVVGGRENSFRASLGHGATVVVTFTDAATGAPVPGACVNALPVNRAPTPGEGVGDCADDTGVLTISRLTPDRYVLFASADDGVHGAQWVGPSGGVGARAAARVVTATAGGTTPVAVRLDGRGSIAGLVTDRATGRPVDGALIDVWGAATTSGADGRYRLDGLGPYRWTLFFGHDAYAGQWSGGGDNRLTATPVRVRTGQTTGYDVRLRRGTALTGIVTGPYGRLPDTGSVSVVSARTFDTIARVDIGVDGRYTARVSGPQDVKLLLETQIRGEWRIGWHDDAPDFAGARTEAVPATGVRTVNITVR